MASLHSISWTKQLILVKLNTIYHYYILQIWLDFDDLQRSVHYKCLTEHKRLLVYERPSFGWFVWWGDIVFFWKTILVNIWIILFYMPEGTYYVIPLVIHPGRRASVHLQSCMANSSYIYMYEGISMKLSDIVHYDVK